MKIMNDLPRPGDGVKRIGIELLILGGLMLIVHRILGCLL